MSELCPLDHGYDAEGHPRQRQQAVGLTVCLWHRDKAERAVAELPSLYEFLGRRLVASGAGGLTGMPSGNREPGIDINHRVAQARTDIRNNLSTWARVAVEERSMHCPPDDLPSIAAFIVAQVEWFSSQPFARQFVNDVVDDWHTARGLSDPNPTRRFEVGPCPEAGCAGILIAQIRPKDSLLPHDVTCHLSPADEETGELLHSWPADRWMTLGRKVVRA